MKTEPRDIRVYTESDWICEVEVLEDLSDEMAERYKLKVVKTLSSHPCFAFLPPNGSVFACEKRSDSQDVPWNLVPKQSSNS